MSHRHVCATFFRIARPEKIGPSTSVKSLRLLDALLLRRVSREK
jgi:hypothetical protein